jgi:sterol desaturase/sphingolipid hydroxylase (fatty acid hydroxylase superfamily)
LLWRFHQVHHSDPNFTATTALRFHFGELLLGLPLRLLGVALLGISIPGVIAFELIFAFANFFEHGDIDLPREFERRLAFLFITPALHRRHHSCEANLLNSNYGTIFSFWDRAFVSFGSSSSDVRVQIGLPDIGDVIGPFEALMMPVRRFYRGR